MIRNLKALGLMLIAVFAMSAMFASVASAETNGELTAEEYPATLDGEDIEGGLNAFTGLGQTIHCENSTYSGSIGGPEARITATPVYEECFDGAREATVTMNGCDYEFHNATDTEGTPPVTTPDEWRIQSDLKCPTGQKVELHIYNDAAHTSVWCTLTIAAQNNLNGLEVIDTTEVNTGELDDIDLVGTVGGIATQSHGTCSAGLTINFNGELDTEVTVTGTHGGHQVGITID